jgi:hypothetical protein
VTAGEALLAGWALLALAVTLLFLLALRGR